MDELRLVRREEQSLIVATDTGQEFRFIVDDTVISEVRHLSRRETNRKVKPREIQALIRAGKSRSEVAEITGLADADIERYEEPVLAERRYILERAHAVPVRTANEADGLEQFGAVIAERLEGLSATDAEWSSWRDEEQGWMVGLDFISHDIAHRAVWSFDHRKSLLSPQTSDAASLSRQEDVGDRLIPRLRAVEAEAQHAHESDGETEPPVGAASAATTESSDEADDADPRGRRREPVDEYTRRREIEQRSIRTGPDAETDYGQTADLLDALRRRRGQREQERPEDDWEREAPQTDEGAGAPSFGEPEAPARSSADDTAPVRRQDGNDAGRKLSDTSTPRDFTGRSVTPESDGAQDQSVPSSRSDRPVIGPAPTGDADRQTRGRRRASIPSWDDILFGTKSDEDPR